MPSWRMVVATNEGEKTVEIDDKTKKSITIDTSSDRAWKNSSERLAAFVRDRFGGEIKMKGNPRFEEVHEDSNQMDLFEGVNNSTNIPAA